MMSTVREDLSTFCVTISCSVLRIIRNVSDKSCRENQNTHFMFDNVFSKIVPFMSSCGENIVEPVTPQMTVWRLRFAYWVPKATYTRTRIM